MLPLNLLFRIHSCLSLSFSLVLSISLSSTFLSPSPLTFPRSHPRCMQVAAFCRRPLNALKRQIKNSRRPRKRRLVALAAVIARYRVSLVSSLLYITRSPHKKADLSYLLETSSQTPAISPSTWSGNVTLKISPRSKVTYDARYHYDLSGATISSTAPEHYD